MQKWFKAVALIALGMTSALAGCTKLSPGTINDFGAEKKVVVTLRDGETIKGHIDEGATVTFTTFGKVYRAKVESVDEIGNIVLSDAYVQEEYERYHLQRERMQGSVLHVRDDVGTISIPAYKIVKVEEISVDRMKSARAAGFWGFTIFVVSRIMGARL